MSGKGIVGVGLVGFALIGLVVLAVQEAGRTEGGETTDLTATGPSDGVVIYYFHGTNRCMTCRKFEAYTGSVLETEFAAQLASGEVVWSPINVEEPQNAHFVEEYALSGKALVLSERIKGEERRWRDLKSIWNKVGDEAVFRAYIRDELRAFLGAST